MEDNVSFEDEVNTASKPHNFIISASATAAAIYDNYNSNNSNQNFASAFNNNHPASMICQEQSPISNKQGTSNIANGNESAVPSVFSKGSIRGERETSWLTRSVTQPNLCSRAQALSLAPTPFAVTQSEESVARLPDLGCGSQVTTSPSVLSSNSYEGLSGNASSQYFDARSSFSAPVELLSEFLSALMSRDYEDALNLCQSILKYEPQNSTALEFYPLLLTKIKHGTDDHQSTSDDDTTGDSDELETNDKDDDEEVATSGDDDDEREGGNKKPPKTEKRQFRSKRVEDSRATPSQEGVARRAKRGEQNSFLCSLGDMSTSNSMDFSVEIDSGRDSLVTTSDSDLNLESGDSLYSSTDSNLNIVRSGSDSLFSSTETGLTLETVINSIQNLGVEGRHQAVK